MKKMLWLLLTVNMPLLAQYPQGSGPEPAIAYTDPGLPTHTVYRPQQMLGKYPVVLWGNGSCVNSNYPYREFLAEVASQGFIVLALGPYRDSPAPREPRPESPADWPPFETNALQLLHGLDWLTLENGRTNKELSGHVDINKVGVMGHSCGGLQAVRVSTDPRISTTVVLNSGLFPDDDQYMIRHEVEQEILYRQHAPIAFFIGGESDIAFINAEQNWQTLNQQNVPAINANLDVGHGATYFHPGGYPFAEGPLAWLKFQLKRDADAAAMFEGENCGFCFSDSWRIRRHMLK